MSRPADSPKFARARVAKVVEVLIFVCWGVIAVSFVAVTLVGHMRPLSLVTLAGAMACLAGILFVLFSSWKKWAHDTSYSLSGKGLGLIFALVGVSLLFVVLTVVLQ